MILMGHVNVALEPYDIDGACECSHLQVRFFQIFLNFLLYN